MQKKSRPSFRFLDDIDLSPERTQNKPSVVVEEKTVQFIDLEEKRYKDNLPVSKHFTTQKKSRPSFRFLGEVDMRPPGIQNKPNAIVKEKTVQPIERKFKDKVHKVNQSSPPREDASPAFNVDPGDDLETLVPDVITHGDEYEVVKALNTVAGFAPGHKLLPHQNIARQWMTYRESENRRGGIISDEMGTGKTVQALVRILDGKATIQDLREGWSVATLVVCPVALINQWRNESNKYVPNLNVLLNHAKSRPSPSALVHADIVITTYETLARDRILPKVRWLRIILDEAHSIKNKGTLKAHACFELESKFKWCMTGTPIQNKVEDLYPFFCFMKLIPLNDWDTFNKKITKPVSRGLTRAAMMRLHLVLNEVMIRRKKDTTIQGRVILKLPPRHVDLVYCPFSKSEKEFYDTVESWAVDEVCEVMGNDEIHGKYMHILVLLLRLRQACDHPRLFYEEYEADDDSKVLAQEVDITDVVTTAHRTQKILPRSAVKLPAAPKALRAPPCSAKIEAIIRILSGIRKRSQGTEKTIVYSQWTTMLDLISIFLKNQGVRYVVYQGSMTPKERNNVLTTLEKDPAVTVALVSLKAGGVGLNLMMCNNVILTDPWWNPATEEQAFDRVHRMGQIRPVNIYKLTTAGTIEERILELQEKKRALAVAALSGERLKSQKLTMEEVVALFGLSAH